MVACDGKCLLDFECNCFKLIFFIIFIVDSLNILTRSKLQTPTVALPVYKLLQLDEVFHYGFLQ